MNNPGTHALSVPDERVSSAYRMDAAGEIPGERQMPPALNLAAVVLMGLGGIGVSGVCHRDLPPGGEGRKGREERKQRKIKKPVDLRKGF